VCGFDRICDLTGDRHGVGQWKRALVQAIRQRRAFDQLEHERPDLQGNIALEPDIARAVHFAHAAYANGGDDLVGSQSNPWLERHGLTGILPDTDVTLIRYS
jgi:hypothetical protein